MGEESMVDIVKKEWVEGGRGGLRMQGSKSEDDDDGVGPDVWEGGNELVDGEGK